MTLRAYALRQNKIRVRADSLLLENAVGKNAMYVLSMGRFVQCPCFRFENYTSNF